VTSADASVRGERSTYQAVYLSPGTHRPSAEAASRIGDSTHRADVSRLVAAASFVSGAVASNLQVCSGVLDMGDQTASERQIRRLRS